jgi:hypothetical protein
MSVLLSRVVDEHTQVMAELGLWATGNGWYPAKPSGHCLENLIKNDGPLRKTMTKFDAGANI